MEQSRAELAANRACQSSVLLLALFSAACSGETRKAQHEIGLLKDVTRIRVVDESDRPAAGVRWKVDNYGAPDTGIIGPEGIISGNWAQEAVDRHAAVTGFSIHFEADGMITPRLRSYTLAGIWRAEDEVFVAEPMPTGEDFHPQFARRPVAPAELGTVRLRYVDQAKVEELKRDHTARQAAFLDRGKRVSAFLFGIKDRSGRTFKEVAADGIDNDFEWAWRMECDEAPDGFCVLVGEVRRKNPLNLGGFAVPETINVGEARFRVDPARMTRVDDVRPQTANAQKILQRLR